LKELLWQLDERVEEERGKEEAEAGTGAGERG